MIMGRWLALSREIFNGYRVLRGGGRVTGKVSKF